MCCFYSVLRSEPLTSDFPNQSSLIILLSIGLLLTAFGAVIFTVVYKKRLKKAVKTTMRPGWSFITNVNGATSVFF